MSSLVRFASAFCFAAIVSGAAAAEPSRHGAGELDEGGRAIIERMAKDLAGPKDFRRLSERDKDRLRRKAEDRLRQPHPSPAPAQHQNGIVRGVEI